MARAFHDIYVTDIKMTGPVIVWQIPGMHHTFPASWNQTIRNKCAAR